MRPSLNPFLAIAAVALAACDVTPDEIEPAAVCEVASAGDGQCPAPESPLAYSMLGPNVQLVIDRSGSMEGHRWDEVLALTEYLPLVGARANLGLTLFPSPVDPATCSAESGTVVPMSEGQAAAEEIASWITRTDPEGSTPMADALEALVEDPGLRCTNRDNVVVLLTDGVESCGGDPVRAVERLVGGDVPVELFVIGFGTSASTDAQLEDIAEAASATTTDNFFTASTATELVDRLAAVTGTCVAQLEQDLPDGLEVSLDGRVLAECAADRCEEGYTADPDHRTVRLEGADCLAFLDGCHELVFDAP